MKSIFIKFSRKYCSRLLYTYTSENQKKKKKSEIKFLCLFIVSFSFDLMDPYFFSRTIFLSGTLPSHSKHVHLNDIKSYAFASPLSSPFSFFSFGFSLVLLFIFFFFRFALFIFTSKILSASNPSDDNVIIIFEQVIRQQNYTVNENSIRLQWTSE